jgi:hypothetical protein
LTKLSTQFLNRPVQFTKALARFAITHPGQRIAPMQQQEAATQAQTTIIRTSRP